MNKNDLPLPMEVLSKMRHCEIGSWPLQLAGFTGDLPDTTSSLKRMCHLNFHLDSCLFITTGVLYNLLAQVSCGLSVLILLRPHNFYNYLQLLSALL